MMTKDNLWDAKQVRIPRLLGAFVTTGAIASLNIVFSQGLAAINKEQRPFDSIQSASRLYIDYLASEIFNHHSPDCGQVAIPRYKGNVVSEDY